MNYRHIFHAGNFGDVFKHALLLPLIRAMQRKEKGFLFLDTHAGIGAYDLSSLPANRTLEYADGIARLWNAANLPAGLADYVARVRQFSRERGGSDAAPRHYPGSPRFAAMLRRPQDRIGLSELHPEDFETLQAELGREPGVSLQQIDAYSALRAYLPPPEKRALVLIDPPYEDRNEATRIQAGLAEALRRFPNGAYAIWYPIKDRAGVDALKARLRSLPLPPTLAAELSLFADEPGDRLNGCGLIVLNPPWQVAAELAPTVESLREHLAVEAGARAGIEWLVEER